MSTEDTTHVVVLALVSALVFIDGKKNIHHFRTRDVNGYINDEDPGAVPKVRLRYQLTNGTFDFIKNAMMQRVQLLLQSKSIQVTENDSISLSFSYFDSLVTQYAISVTDDFIESKNIVAAGGHHEIEVVAMISRCRQKDILSPSLLRTVVPAPAGGTSESSRSFASADSAKMAAISSLTAAARTIGPPQRNFDTIGSLQLNVSNTKQCSSFTTFSKDFPTSTEEQNIVTLQLPFFYKAKNTLEVSELLFLCKDAFRGAITGKILQIVVTGCYLTSATLEHIQQSADLPTAYSKDYLRAIKLEHTVDNQLQ
jgi:hypothetical protein